MAGSSGGGGGGGMGGGNYYQNMMQGGTATAAAFGAMAGKRKGAEREKNIANQMLITRMLEEQKAKEAQDEANKKAEDQYQRAQDQYNVAIGYQQAGIGMLDEGLGKEQAMYEQSKKYYDPYGKLGEQGMTTVRDLMGYNGADAQAAAEAKLGEESAAYKFRMAQGTQAMERSAAARGGLNSGRLMAGLQEYGQGLASEEWDKNYSRMMGTGMSLVQLGMAVAGAKSGIDREQAGAIERNYAGRVGVQTNVANLAAQKAAFTGGTGTGMYMDMGRMGAESYRNRGNIWGDYYGYLGGIEHDKWKTYSEQPWKVNNSAWSGSSGGGGGSNPTTGYKKTNRYTADNSMNNAGLDSNEMNSMYTNSGYNWR